MPQSSLSPPQIQSNWSRPTKDKKLEKKTFHPDHIIKVTFLSHIKMNNYSFLFLYHTFQPHHFSYSLVPRPHPILCASSPRWVTPHIFRSHSLSATSPWHFLSVSYHASPQPHSFHPHSTYFLLKPHILWATSYIVPQYPKATPLPIILFKPHSSYLQIDSPSLTATSQTESQHLKSHLPRVTSLTALDAPCEFVNQVSWGPKSVSRKGDDYIQ